MIKPFILTVASLSTLVAANVTVFNCINSEHVNVGKVKLAWGYDSEQATWNCNHYVAACKDQTGQPRCHASHSRGLTSEQISAKISNIEHEEMKQMEAKISRRRR